MNGQYGWGGGGFGGGGWAGGGWGGGQPFQRPFRQRNPLASGLDSRINNFGSPTPWMANNQMLGPNGQGSVGHYDPVANFSDQFRRPESSAPPPPNMSGDLSKLTSVGPTPAYVPPQQNAPPGYSVDPYTNQLVPSGSTAPYRGLVAQWSPQQLAGLQDLAQYGSFQHPEQQNWNGAPGPAGGYAWMPV